MKGRRFSFDWELERDVRLFPVSVTVVVGPPEPDVGIMNEYVSDVFARDAKGALLQLTAAEEERLTEEACDRMTE